TVKHPPSDSSQKDSLVFPQDVAERNGRPAVEAPSEVVPRVADVRARDEVGGEVDPVVLERELARVGQVEGGRVHQRADGDRLRQLRRVTGTGEVARAAESL